MNRAIPQADIAVIGGTGLYEITGLENVAEITPDTPFGSPSDAIVIGILEGKRVAFLPRHGRGHRYNPTQIPARANIFALKMLGVRFVLSVSAVGSLQESIRPLDLVIPDQIIDRTRQRANTFFSDGIVAHVGFADPFCADLRRQLIAAAAAPDITVHNGGTYLAMEGPQFSTRAESELYRSWGASVIGMTALPEAKLAREAEMCYALLACSTDYDCWHPDHDSVTIQMIVENLGRNVARSKSIIRKFMKAFNPSRTCSCQGTLTNTILTAPDAIPQKVKNDLRPLIGRYLA